MQSMRAFCLCACEGGISTKPPEKDELEAKIANDVRSYLSICGRGDSSEEEQLRAVCSGLAWLLAELLQKSDKWSSYHWVDAISPASTEIISTGELNIQGLGADDMGGQGPYAGVVGAVFGYAARGRGYWRNVEISADARRCSLGVGQGTLQLPPKGLELGVPKTVVVCVFRLEQSQIKTHRVLN